MRRRIAAGVVLVLVLAVSTIGHAASVETFRSTGFWASGSFSWSDECSSSSFYAWAGQDVTRSGRVGGAQSTASVSISSYDWCTGTQLSGSVTTSGVGFEGTLDSASLGVLTVMVDEWGTGADACSYEYLGSHEYTISVEWTGTGDISRGHSTWFGSWQGGFSSSRNAGSWRDATVNMQVSVDGVDLVVDQSNASGQLGRHSDGYVTVTRY